MVRDDWEYPSTAVKDNTGLPQREPLGYKLREESLSDIEAEQARETAAAKRASHAHTHAREYGRGHGHEHGKTDPYRFENPDAVGDAIVERKRKRRKLVAEEMSWNDGLRVWMNRRDAWTGAVRRRPKDSVVSVRSPATKPDGGGGGGHEQDGSRQRSGHFFRRSSSMLAHGLGPGPGHERNKSGSSVAAGEGAGLAVLCSASPMDTGATSSPTRSHASPVEGSSIDSVEPPSTNTNKDKDKERDSDKLKDEGDNEGPWLPIFPPLLPADDSLRDRINPKAYATIYSKIVVQGLAPNVPIPLVHMIPALVAGWKAEGNWPPQPMSISAADVKKGRRSSAFAKWHKEHAHDSKAVDGQVAHEREDGKSRVRRSISMMKRVLGGGGNEGEKGLEELGIEFREQDEEEMEKNVTLNRGLVGH